MTEPAFKKITIIAEDLVTGEINTIKFPKCMAESINFEHVYERDTKLENAAVFGFAKIIKVEVKMELTAFPDVIDDSGEEFFCIKD